MLVGKLTVFSLFQEVESVKRNHKNLISIKKIERNTKLYEN